MRSAIFFSVGLAALFSVVACKSSDPGPEDPSEGETGGSSAKGGQSNVGGASNRGGSSATGGGGASNKGGGGSVSAGNGGKSGGAGNGGKGGTGERGGGGQGGASGAEGGDGGQGGDGGDGGQAAGASGDAGGSGQGGDGGAAGAGPGDAGPTGVTPTCDSSDKCTFAWGDYKFVADAKVAGRIIEFSLKGKNIIVPPSAMSGENANNYGSTFLTSPQADFGWPPPAAMDTSPYTKEIVPCGASTCLHLTSSSITVPNGSKPAFTIEKKFSVNATANVVTIVYSIVNQGTSAVQFAPWEVTRAQADGLTFWPSGANPPVAGNGMALPPTTDSGGYTFYAYKKPSANQKLNGEGGPKGYIAHVNDDLILVKAWTDVPNDAQHQAPAEGEIELFVSSGGAYIEVEEQGAYTSIPAKGRLDWQVRWSLQNLASPISSPSAAVGDEALIAKADSMATTQ